MVDGVGEHLSQALRLGGDFGPDAELNRGQVFLHEELVLRRSKHRRSGGGRGFHLLDVSLRDSLDVVHAETSIESLDELLALCHGDLDRR